MLILIDSNVLLRTAKPDDPVSPIALQTLSRLTSEGHELTIVPQCAYEFYVVATRPTQQNGLGLEPTEAYEDLLELQQLYRVLPDAPAIFELWKRLIEQHQVRGKTAHDARLVAAMLSHGVPGILTFNASDFRRYEPEIIVMEPSHSDLTL